MTIQIPVEAKLKSGDLDADLAQVKQKINALGQAIAQANKIKFNPISQVTLEDLKKITAQFEALKRASPVFAQKIARTGQGKQSFFDLDWNLMVTSSRLSREAQKYGTFTKVMAGTGAGFIVPPQPSGGGGGRSGGGGGRNAPGPGGGGGVWRGGARRVVGAGLDAAGPVGYVANSALSTGMTGGVTAGLAGLVGGIFALGIGKAVGSVTQRIGAAQTDLIGYDTLKRMLGDVNVGFETLQNSLHSAAYAVDVTYPEILKMGKEFSQISGISGEASKNLAEEVRVGGGFGRSFGMDPSQSNMFFARMRQFQVTNTSNDSRRLALDIGEAIAKSGTFAKADEMLQAISSFATQQTRLGLTSANVEGYAGALSGLVGSGTPGLDPMGAAGVLSSVNSAIAGGGGEASQNFMYMAIGKRLGLNPIQTDLLREQGAFGTGASEFEPGGLYSQFAKKYGIKEQPWEAMGSHETNLQMVMDKMKSVYGGSPFLMVNAMSHLFGINNNQAMALATIDPNKLGGLQQTLAANHVDLKQMSGTGINALAQIMGGDRATLVKQAHDLWPSLSGDETRKLDAAESGGDLEKLRSVLIQLTATHGQVQTEGQQTRKTIQDLDRDLMNAAIKMIGPLNTMRDTLLYAFGNHGSMTADDMHNAVVSAQRREVNNRADARIKAAMKEYFSHTSGVDTLTGQPIDIDADTKAYNSIVVTAKAAAEKQRKEGLAKIDAEEAARTAANKTPSPANTLPMPDWMKDASVAGPGQAGASSRPGMDALTNAIIQQESGGVNIDPKTGRLLQSSKGALGMAQILPSTAANPGYGITPLKDYSEASQRKFVGDHMRAMMKHYGGNLAQAIASYNAGPERVDKAVEKYGTDWLSHLPAETRKYVPEVEARLGTAMPQGASAAAAPSTQRVAIDGTFTLNGPNNVPVAAPLTVQKYVGVPAPYGSAQ